MMNKPAILHGLLSGLICTLCMLFSTNASAAQPTVTDPFTVSQFTPAKKNVALYGDYRSKWHRMTGFELSSLHWNQFVAVFINQSPEIYRNNHIEYLRTSQDDYDDDEDEDEETTVADKYKRYPIGTVIAKEGFTSHQGKPGTPTFLVLMEKREKNYDPSHGNWEYMQFSADGSTMLRGKGSDPAVSKLCSGCHINVAERDYIFSSFLTNTTP